MFKKYYLFFLWFIVPSCATILNHREEKMYISSDKSMHVVSIDSSILNYKNTNFYKIKLRKQPITLNLIVDSSPQNLLIKSRSSIAYWANIYFNAGIAMLVEHDNPKRYGYPKTMYLQLKDHQVVVSPFAPTPKGTLDWHLASPYINFFNVSTPYGHMSRGGFLGLESGLDYYYKTNHYVSMYGGVAINFKAPVPAPVHYEGDYQTVSSIYASIRNNYRLKRFDLGYGLAYSSLNWRKLNSDSTEVLASQYNNAIGLSFNSSYRFGQHFFLGLLYQPYFLRINKKIYADYEHQLSIELIWKIHIK